MRRRAPEAIFAIKTVRNFRLGKVPFKINFFKKILFELKVRIKLHIPTRIRVKVQMHSRVIVKIQFLEHRLFERFEKMKYQNMHIFRIEIKFSLQINKNF